MPHPKAVKWYRLAAKQGFANSQNNLGIMHLKGEGVPQNDTEAMKWYRLAANQGLATSQTSLGTMFTNGQGGPQDYAEAVKWYRLAANQGDDDAQYNLGVMYAIYDFDWLREEPRVTPSDLVDPSEDVRLLASVRPNWTAHINPH